MKRSTPALAFFATAVFAYCTRPISSAFYLAEAQTTPITQNPQTWAQTQTFLAHNIYSYSTVTASTTHSIAGGQTAPLSDLSLVNAANASDAVGLPACINGTEIIVISVGSTATMAVYPQLSTDTIDGGSAGASVALTAAHRGANFYCNGSHNWTSDLFGAVSS